MKKLLLIIGIILAGAGIWYAAQSLNTTKNAPREEIATQVDITSLPIFKEGLSAAGIELDDLGFHSFSPDGKYFLFTGIRNSDTIPAKTYLMALATGEIRLLPGIILRGFEDPRIVTLFEGNDLVLYDIGTGTHERIPTDGNIFAGTLSPDGTKYAFNTIDGIRIYDRTAKTTGQVSQSQYDGATAWLSDSIRILGWKDTGEPAFEAGNMRQFGVWDINANEFSPLAADTVPSDTIRNVTWLIPDKVARINSGWDDGSLDRIIDMDTLNVVNIGETSGALMGGMKEDPARGLLALLTGYAEAGKTAPAEIYRGTEKISSTMLPGGYFREDVEIIDEQALVYIRKRIGKNFSVDAAALVRLDASSGTETVLKELPAGGYSSVSLSPDRRIWVVSSGNRFFAGNAE